MGISINGSFNKIRSFKGKFNYPVPSNISGTLEANVTGRSVVVTFGSINFSVRNEYRLDGGPWTVLPSNGTLTNLSDGTHQIEIRGLNQQGVPGPSSSSVFKINSAFSFASSSFQATVATLPVTSGYGGSQGALSADGSTLALSLKLSNSAAVDVWKSNGTSWTFHSRINAPTGDTSFGYAMRLNSNGTVLYICNAASASDYIYVYKRTANDWYQSHKIIGTAGFVTNGISLSGDDTILTAHGNSSTMGSITSTSWNPLFTYPYPSHPGTNRTSRDGTMALAQVSSTKWFIYKRVGASGAKQSEITFSNPVYSAAISQDGLLVAGMIPGGVDVYTRESTDSTRWILTANFLTSMNAATSKLSLNSDATLMCIGSVNSGDTGNAIAIYERQGQAWYSQKRMFRSFAQNNDLIGGIYSEISLNGSVVVTSAPGKRVSQGFESIFGIEVI